MSHTDKKIKEISVKLNSLNEPMAKLVNFVSGRHDPNFHIMHNKWLHLKDDIGRCMTDTTTPINVKQVRLREAEKFHKNHAFPIILRSKTTDHR